MCSAKHHFERAFCIASYLPTRPSRGFKYSLAAQSHSPAPPSQQLYSLPLLRASSLLTSPPSPTSFPFLNSPLLSHNYSKLYYPYIWRKIA